MGMVECGSAGRGPLLDLEFTVSQRRAVEWEGLRRGPQKGLQKIQYERQKGKAR